MKRWHEDVRIMLRRKKKDRIKRYLELGYFRKRHPCDCGHSQCYMCHSDKIDARLAKSEQKRKAIEWELNN